MKNVLLIITFLLSNNLFSQVSDFESIDFTIADATAKLYKGSALNNLPLLAHKLTYRLPTDPEKFRAIYTWVCSNIKGDSYQHDKVSRKRKKLKNDSLAYIKWNNKYKKIAFKKLIENKKTMCTGYAYLIKELCFFANIDCKIINGYGRSSTSNVASLDAVNHSWNAVKLNNKWYLCDATWSSGYMVADSFFVNDYNDGYFLTDPDLFAKNHYPLNKKWLLSSTLINAQFIASPIVYGETFKHQILPIFPNEINSVSEKNKDVNFAFKALNIIETNKFSLVEINGANTHKLKIYNIKNENGIVTFNYRFKRSGFYDVHLKIENDIVASYTIEVI